MSTKNRWITAPTDPRFETSDATLEPLQQSINAPVPLDGTEEAGPPQFLTAPTPERFTLDQQEYCLPLPVDQRAAGYEGVVPHEPEPADWGADSDLLQRGMQTAPTPPDIFQDKTPAGAFSPDTGYAEEPDVPPPERMLVPDPRRAEPERIEIPPPDPIYFAHVNGTRYQGDLQKALRLLPPSGGVVRLDPCTTYRTCSPWPVWPGRRAA